MCSFIGRMLELLQVPDMSHLSNLLPHASKINIPLNSMVLPGPWSIRSNRALSVQTTEDAAKETAV